MTLQDFSIGEKTGLVLENITIDDQGYHQSSTVSAEKNEVVLEFEWLLLYKLLFKTICNM